MKKLIPYLFCFTFLYLLAINSNAQTKQVQSSLQSPPPNVIIDGHLKDWGDSLRYYNQDKQLYYTLANDKENLYVAIRMNDRTEQIRVLNAGLTLSIDTKGRKKETFAITFPLAEHSNLSQLATLQQQDGDLAKEDRDELLQARLTKLREIKVSGFKDIEGDMITTSNTYGIKTALDYDKDGNLVYEAAIPLKFFHADDLNKNEWAFNFKINGITRPDQNKEGTDQQSFGGGGHGGRGGGGGGRGGHGSGGHGGQHTGGAPIDRSELSKSEDFWEKFYLAR